MKFRKKDDDEGLPDWMGTYGDMVTLLLTFFIMLFSMATLDKQRYQLIVDSLKGQFAYEGVDAPYAHEKGDTFVQPSQRSNTAEPTKSLVSSVTVSPEPTLDPLINVIRMLEEAIKKYGLEDYVKVLDDDTKIIVRIDSVILFDSGSADLKNDSKPALKGLSNSLKVLKKDITVQGHTDSVPIKSSQFPSNWELSTKRATNVVIFLIDSCGFDPAILTATGNGEYHPILPNDSELNRQKNRRIDIVINKKQPGS